jgi:hypothetical protein
MSILDAIQDRVAEGALFLLEPPLKSDPRPRDLFLSVELMTLLDGQHRFAEMKRRMAYLRANLLGFVQGNWINACLIPYKAQRAHMARLDRPLDEVWDYRSGQDKPALRVFGRFAAVDTFVAFTCYPRSKPLRGLDRPVLGGRDSEVWTHAINECKREWHKVFPTYDAIHKDDIHEYISARVVLI